MSKSIELQEFPNTFIIIPKNIFFQELGIYEDKIKGKIIDLLDNKGKIIVSGKIKYIDSHLDHVNSTITFVNILGSYGHANFDSVRMNKNDAAQINNDFNQEKHHLFRYEDERPLFTKEQRRLPQSPKGGRKTRQRKSRSRKTRKSRKQRKQRKTHKRRV
jgi:hypothetical protein